MFDVLIVGAGPSGLCAAKTILECDDAVNLRILDSNKTVGGVWAEENVWPALTTNNLRGTLDFTDFPMHDGFGVADGQAVPGQVMHNYLTAYAQHFDLLKLIDFETRVLEISRLDDGSGWKVRVQQSSEQRDLQTRKLIIATGVLNKPYTPSMKGSDEYAAPIIHSAELGQKSKSLAEDPDVKTIAVLGGGKSAYDAVYVAICAGKEVEWIIRKSGKGPCWVFPPYTNIGPFKVWREKLTLRRITSFFSPCFWQDGFKWIRYLLHFTTLGRKITQKFWANLGASTLDDCGYAKHETLKTLTPETNPFWYGTHTGAYNYEKDLFGCIKSGQVRLHREDISHLSKHAIHLANDRTLPTDALITATGFSGMPTMTFTPSDAHSDLGIPTVSLTPQQRDFWKNLNQRSERYIATTYPRLLHGPFTSPSSTTALPYTPGLDAPHHHTPYRLYRAIAPPGLTARGDRSLAFIGMFSNVATTLRLELQCLWTYAYLTDKLAIDERAVFDETALFARYVRYRAPFGHGRFYPDLVFDQLPYLDMLMRDLGLRYWRKGNVLAEMFAPYGQGDYRGLVQEWLSKQKERPLLSGPVGK